MGRHGEHAVVIGASMGGLVTAAALQPHFDRVTVIERDLLPLEPAHRRGVPQSRHAHGLQPGGLLALDDLLPGLLDALQDGGAIVGDVLSRGGWYVGGGWLNRTLGAGVPGIGITRPYLEHCVRTHVADLPGVALRDGTQVCGLVTDRVRGRRPRVVGVEIAATETGATPTRLDADLVVDASGRASRLPAWLAALGCAPPAEEQVRCRMAYLTRRWRLAEDVFGGDVVTVITPAATPHFGVAIAQEDGSHIVTLGGLLDSGPERTDTAYRTFAAGLPDPRIGYALEGAEALTDFQSAHFPYSRRYRYDRLSGLPAGLLALGDSIASFNPMYGQGMTVASLQAVALRDHLARGPLNARRFFKQAHRIADVAWKISTGGDLRFPEVEGRRTADMRLMNRYLDRLTLAARTDPLLARQFLRVATFIERPESLFRPSIVRRALSGSRAARKAAASGQPSESLATAAR